jgi:hypothetical protein
VSWLVLVPVGLGGPLDLIGAEGLLLVLQLVSAGTGVPVSRLLRDDMRRSTRPGGRGRSGVRLAGQGCRSSLLFFKVAVFRDGSQTTGPLAATGYLLDQTPQLGDVDDVLARAAAADQPPPLGPFRAYQVLIADLADLTGLDLTQTIAPDLYSARTAGDRPQATRPWRRLTALSDFQL